VVTAEKSLDENKTVKQKSADCLYKFDSGGKVASDYKKGE